MKRVCLLLVALFLLFAACQQTEPAQPLPQLPQTVQQPDSLLPEETPQVEETADQTVPLETVPELCIGGYAYLVPGAAGKVFICREITSESTGAQPLTEVLVYDAQRGEISAKGQLPAATYLIPQYFEDGTVCARSYQEATFYFFDAAMTLVDTISLPHAEGFISHDKLSYYFVEDGQLHRHDLASDFDEPLQVAAGLPVTYINNMHPSEDVLYLTVQTDPYGVTSADALVNVETGELLWLSDVYATTSFVPGQIRMLQYVDTHYRLSYGGTDGAEMYAFTLPITATSQLSFVQNGAYLACSETADTVVQTGTFWLYDLSETVTRADITAYADSFNPANAIYLEEGNCILSLVYDLQEGRSEAVVLHLDALQFEQAPEQPVRLAPEAYINQALVDHYFSLSEPSGVREELSALRTYADELETRYSVEILISSECRKLEDYSGFTVQTTDLQPYETESTWIYGALQTLDTTLSRYPEGFFAQFRNEKFFGIRFMLVGSITSDYGVAAFEFCADGWFNIVYDVQYPSLSLDNNVSHELWHATEDKMGYMDGNWVDERLWSSFNPEGFAYSSEYENYTQNSGDWVYYNTTNASEVYFIDIYSKTFAKEDRARIMEYAMTFPGVMEFLKGSNAIMQKLQYMSDLVRKSFDTTGWPERTRWEQCLP